jgi:hypothetical protein
MKCAPPLNKQKLLKTNRSPDSKRGRRLRDLATGLIPLVAFVVLAGGLQRAQAEDALFIDENGNVGIGTANPKAKLEVGGTLKLLRGEAVNAFSNDGTLGGNSDQTVPTEKAVKSYLEQALEQEPWHVIGVGAADAATLVRYFRDSIGIVHLNGEIRGAFLKRPTGEGLIDLFSLPDGYRPNFPVNYVTPNYDGTILRILILEDGKVWLHWDKRSPGTPDYRIFLDSITFRAGKK